MNPDEAAIDRRRRMNLKLREQAGARLWPSIRDRLAEFIAGDRRRVPLERSDALLLAFESGLTQRGPEFVSHDPNLVVGWLTARTAHLAADSECWLVLLDAQLIGVLPCKWYELLEALPSISRHCGEEGGVLFRDGAALLVSYCEEEPLNKFQCYARERGGDDLPALEIG